MKKHGIAIILAVVCVLGQAGVLAQTESEKAAIEQEALKVMSAIEQAAQNLDASHFSDFVLETGTTALDGRLYLNREEAQRTIEKSYQAASKQEMTVQHHVTVLSPTAVLVVSDGAGRATLADGREVGPIPFAQTVVLVLKDGQWKVLHAHSSSDRPR